MSVCYDKNMSHRSYFLELCSPSGLQPKPFPSSVGVEVIESVEAARCQFLWREVGKGFWNERSDWTEKRWSDYLQQDSVSFHVFTVNDEDAGFFELAATGNTTRLEGFGLLPAFRERGLGGGLLTFATLTAFDGGASRIWLHTATDDHPHALPNYLNRGYKIFREEELNNPL